MAGRKKNQPSGDSVATGAEAGKPTPTERKQNHESRLLQISEGHKTFRWAMVVALIGVLGYFGFRSVEVAAGKETNFRAILNAVANVTVSEGVLGILVLVSGGTAVFNYKGRKKAEVAAGRAAELEKIIDAARTGSGLLEDGRNPKGDPE